MLSATANGCFVVMKGIVKAVWNAGLSRLFRSDAHRIEESRPRHPETDSSKRRKILHEEPRWITEEERERLYVERYRLIGALNQAHIRLRHATTPQDGEHHSDQLGHIDLSVCAPLLIELEVACELLDTLYSKAMLSRLTRLHSVPGPNMLYRPKPHEIKSIQSTMSLLEKPPPAVLEILDTFNVSREDTKAVRIDLQAIIGHLPIPSLSLGFSDEKTRRSFSPDLLLSGVDDNAHHIDDQIRSAGSTEAMPGSFPPGLATDELNISEPGAADGRLGSHDRDLKDVSPLLLCHKTIPIDIIRQHLIPPEFVSNFGQQVKTTGARRRDARLSRGIMPSPLRRHPPNKEDSPRRKHKLDYRNRKNVKWDPGLGAEGRTPDGSYCWRCRSYHSPFITEARSHTRFEMAAYDDKESDTDCLCTHAHGLLSPCTKPQSPSGSSRKDHTRSSRHPRFTKKTLLSSYRHSSPLTTMSLSSREASSASSADRDSGSEHGISCSPSDISGSNSSTDQQVAASNSLVTTLAYAGTEGEEVALRKARESILSRLKSPGSPVHHGNNKLACMGDLRNKAGQDPSLAILQEKKSSLDLLVKDLAISDEKEGDLGDYAARQQLQADETCRIERQEREEREREEARLAEENRRLLAGGLRAPCAMMISAISKDWLQKIQATVTGTDETKEFARTKSGNPLRMRDFSTLIPARAWLNDEVINGALEWLDDSVNSLSSRGRKCLSINSFVWNRIKGGQSTERVMKRAGVRDADTFLTLETVLIPICAGNHWTLAVIRPQQRTIAHMDSLNASGSLSVVGAAHTWVRTICGDQYIEDEWRVVSHPAPEQNNGWDCGVHVITNGICVALGLSPAETYESDQLPLQRRRIAGMLLNGGFRAEFELSRL